LFTGIAVKLLSNGAAGRLRRRSDRDEIRATVTTA
jgi:hypothetical protein